jgi:Icc-related predicted phosphoesterase
MPTVRIAAMSDVHVSKTSHGTLAPILAQVADRADVLLLCGDLTDYGTTEEARVLVKELGTLRLPTVAVLGNHDYESGHPEQVVDALRDVGVTVLDGDSHEVHGIGFAGVKGFCGGFGRGTLGSWGEPMVKAFVKEALDETLKLETALARLRTPQKVAVLHYSPVRDTVEGEPLEIFPFLGCGRHEEPLLRYKVNDLTRIDDAPCECGRTLARLPDGILGRADDMLIVRAANVYPSAIDEIVKAFPDVSGNYQVIIDRPRDLDTMTLRLERTRSLSSEEQQSLVGQIDDRIKMAFGSRADIEVLAPGSLPTFVYKAKRIIDKRKGESEQDAIAKAKEQQSG